MCLQQWRLVTEKIGENRRKTSPRCHCYFIQVNYLSLLSYIHWKLSNKTITYKTSLKNILLNGKRLLLLLAVGVWTTQSVNMGRCVPGRLIMYSGLIYKTKKNTNVYPFQDSIPSHMYGRQLLYPLCYQCIYFTTAQDITLITIAQNNCVAALYCVPVVPLTLCPPAGRTKRKLWIIFLTASLWFLQTVFFLSEMCLYFLWNQFQYRWKHASCLSIAGNESCKIHRSIFFIYGCINVRMKFGNCYWTNLLSILYSGCWLVREDVLP